MWASALVSKNRPCLDYKKYIHWVIWRYMGSDATALLISLSICQTIFLHVDYQIRKRCILVFFNWLKLAPISQGVDLKNLAQTSPKVCQKKLLHVHLIRGPANCLHRLAGLRTFSMSRSTSWNSSGTYLPPATTGLLKKAPISTTRCIFRWETASKIYIFTSKECIPPIT